VNGRGAYRSKWKTGELQATTGDVRGACRSATRGMQRRHDRNRAMTVQDRTGAGGRRRQEVCISRHERRTHT
jgi:hypothetical protein